MLLCCPHLLLCCSYLTDVYVMIFLGFGALMTFLRRYSYSAIALNFACSCLVVLEAIVAVGWAQQGFGAIEIDLPLLIDAAFCAGAAMISFGAVLGKASPAQLVWLFALEVPLYAANAQVRRLPVPACAILAQASRRQAGCWSPGTIKRLGGSLPPAATLHGTAGCWLLPPSPSARSLPAHP